MTMMKVSLLLSILGFLLSGCTHLSPEARTQNAEALAANGGWEKRYVETNRFTFVAFAPKHSTPIRSLRIYIEGDGQAWQHRKLPSQDPTPINPIALKLALKDPQAAVYLARPCQYVQGQHKKGCEQRYWTHARFSEEVIDATDQAITALMRQSHAQRLILVGYSGGAAVAALVAARRRDVDKLITVAGNLDHAAWTTLHNISPLSGSLNPVDSRSQIQSIEQLHLVGAEDKIIPASIVSAYVRGFPDATKIKMRSIDRFDHHCCWVEQWPSLMNRP